MSKQLWLDIQRNCLCWMFGRNKIIFLLLTALDVRMGKYEILTYESGIYENRYVRIAKYETVRRQSMKNDAKV